MMTSYEAVRRAIEFDCPDRLPIQFDAMGLNDTYGVGWKTPKNWQPSVEGEDEWGCVWKKSEIQNMGQVKHHPLADWAAMNDYRWPDPDDPSRYEDMENQLEGAGDKYVCTGIFMILFERMWALHGYADLLADLYLAPDKVHELADRVLNVQMGIVRNVGERFRGKIHGCTMTEDWGTQQNVVVGLPQWREFFKPRYKKLFNLIHSYDIHVWVHSCGKVNDYIGDWIEVGLDVINLQQPSALGIEEIGERYAGKICFSSLNDIQTTLPFGAYEDMDREAEMLMERWATPRGGFMLCDYGDGAAIGVSDDKKRHMYETFKRLGDEKFGKESRMTVRSR